MFSNFLRARRLAKQIKEQPIVEETIAVQEEVKVGQSKTIYAYLGEELVGQYDSITKCAQLLGLSRAMTKKAIENQTILESGFILTFNKK